MHDAVRLTKAVPYPGMHDAAVPPADYCTMSCIAAAAALLAPARGVRARWLVPYKKIAVSVRASVAGICLARADRETRQIAGWPAVTAHERTDYGTVATRSGAAAWAPAAGSAAAMAYATAYYLSV